MTLRAKLEGKRRPSPRERDAMTLMVGVPVCLLMFWVCLEAWGRVHAALVLPSDAAGVLPYVFCFTLAASSVTLLAAELAMVGAWRAWSSSVVASVEEPKSYDNGSGRNGVDKPLIAGHEPRRELNGCDTETSENQKNCGDAWHILRCSETMHKRQALGKTGCGLL